MLSQDKRDKLRDIIFEADTPAGKLYDICLILTVTLSVLVVMLDSIAAIHDTHGVLLRVLEWIFTVLFTIDYITRLSCVDRPMSYAVSFFGMVDLLGVIPTYLSLIIPGTQYLAVIRFLRVLRIFHVLKLPTYQAESRMLVQAIRASHRRITVFLFCVLIMVVILGTLMYVVEGSLPSTGFTSIPRAIYWAIVTLTTVGYGDISPQTGFGQAIAAMIMILGYSIIVVPTGIVASSMTPQKGKAGAPTCLNCHAGNHDHDARHCKYCGHTLSDS